MGLASGKSLGNLQGQQPGVNKGWMQSNGIWMDNMYCRGNEQRLDQCNFNGWGHNNCDHSEDVHIECEGITDVSASGATGGIRVVNKFKSFYSMQSTIT